MANLQAEIDEKMIEEARDLLKPSPVRLHHIPDWFRRSLMAVYGPTEYGYTAGWAVLDRHRRAFDWQWLDHQGSTALRDGRQAFVSEPYAMSFKDMQQIDRLAKDINCETWVTPNSWWFPGATIRIVFAQYKI